MSHDLYIFGSAMRGEISGTSDIDVLVVPLDNIQTEYPEGWSPSVCQACFHDFKQGSIAAIYPDSDRGCASGP